MDVYLGDERCVPPDDPDSNHRMIRETLLDTVGPVGSDHPMYRRRHPEAAAAAYQAEIEPLAGFDLVHLGLGPDGHCASLFPGVGGTGRSTTPPCWWWPTGIRGPTIPTTGSP